MTSQIAIIGAGYVGLPLAVAFAEAGRARGLRRRRRRAGRADLPPGGAHIEDVPVAALAPLVAAGSIAATTDYAAVRRVPTRS